MNPLSGYFMAPQNFSVNDGDGIRTVIFFAGCPLACKWCANPESSTGFKSATTHKNQENTFIYNYTVEALLAIIEKQRLFYRYSNGGITFSGGEPTMQPDMLRALTNKLFDKGYNLAIETSGYFEFEALKDIFEKMDLIFIDLKHMDDGKHKFFTGVSNQKILENISRISELEVPMVVRVPLIGTVNADTLNIRRTAKFLSETMKKPTIELLPYHAFGDEKYDALGLEKPSIDFYTPSNETIRELEAIIRAENVEVVRYK